MKIKIKPTQRQVALVQAGKVPLIVLARKLGCTAAGLFLALTKRHGYKARRPWRKIQLSSSDVKRYEDGDVTIAGLAAEHKSTSITIRHRLVAVTKIHGKNTHTVRSSRRVAKLREQVVRLFRAGKSIREIGKKQDLSPQRISQLVAESGAFTQGPQVGMRPLWCKRCSAQMFASRFVAILCPKCAKEPVAKCSREPVAK